MPTTAAARTLALGLILASAIGLAGCGEAETKASDAKERPATPVRVAAVTEAATNGIVRATGTVAFKREVPMSFMITGIVQDLSVDVGDRVAAGQRLATLDKAEIAARLREADANVDRTGRDVARLAPLVAKGFASSARLDDARAAYAAARAARDAVAFNRDLSEIVAPADAIVLRRPAEPGQIVAAGSPVLTLGDLGSGHVVVAGLADADVVRVALGDRAEARIAGLAAPLGGHVSRIAGKADERTGVFDVEVTLDPIERVLPSGLVAQVAVTTRPGADGPVLAIPPGAVIESFGAEATVYVVDPAVLTVARRRIAVAGISGSDVRVRSGLAAGELVVATGAAYLREGDRVTIGEGPGPAAGIVAAGPDAATN
jgi:RND family efflux transporter MFP subunit